MHSAVAVGVLASIFAGPPAEGSTDTKPSPVRVQQREIRELVDVVRNASYYALRDREEKQAIAALVDAGEAAAPAIAKLLAHGLENREKGWIQVYRPLFILEQMGPHAAVALEGVTAALDDQHAAVVTQATRVLSQLGPKAKAALPALLRNRTRFQSRKQGERWVRILEATIWKIDPATAKSAGIPKPATR